MRAVWLAVGSVLTAFALLLSSLSLVAEFGRARPPMESSDRSLPYDGEQLAIDATGGDVHLMIMAGIAGEVRVERTMQWTQAKPAISEKWDGKTLTLGTECRSEEIRDFERCFVNYSV